MKRLSGRPVRQCLAPFLGWNSCGPTFDKSLGRYRIRIKNGSDIIVMSYARYIMSIHIGMILDKTLHVDHIDGDRTHDELSNLQLLTKKENSSKGSHRSIKSSVDRLICPCGNEFEKKSWVSKHRKISSYCSKRCVGAYAKHNEKSSFIEKISPVQMIDLMICEDFNKLSICNQSVGGSNPLCGS